MLYFNSELQLVLDLDFAVSFYLDLRSEFHLIRDFDLILEFDLGSAFDFSLWTLIISILSFRVHRGLMF